MMIMGNTDLVLNYFFSAFKRLQEIFFEISEKLSQRATKFPEALQHSTILTLPSPKSQARIKCVSRLGTWINQ